MLRFATSPTGEMHIETLRLAIVNYLVAQQQNKRFTVRIDDTDKALNIEGKDTEIMQILEKFALTHDSVFHQSEHLHIHQTLAIKLLEQNKAFICTCADKDPSKEKCSAACATVNKGEHANLRESGVPFVIRIKNPENSIVFNDTIKGKIMTLPQEIDTFIILKSDGIPTPDFASACDDMLSGISTIIRSEAHLLSTAKQIYIKTQLGYEEEVSYAHLPIILNGNGKEFSKDDNTSYVKWLFEEGFIPDAIINYLLMLGNTKTTQEFFTLPEAIAWFNIEDISKSAVTFDIDALYLINKKHLELMDEKLLSTLFGFADEDIGKLAKVFLNEVSTIKELRKKIEPIFAPKDFSGAYGKEMRILADIIANAPMIDDFNVFKSTLIKASRLKEQNLIKALGYLLTGTDTDSKLEDIYPHIKSYLLEVAS